MNQEIKQRWVSALRSGEYKQAKRALHPTNGGFCCLGVLCDLYLQERDRGWQSEGINRITNEPYPFDSALCEGEGDVLPYSVQVWAGLDAENPAVRVGSDRWADLAYLNDGGSSFVELAELIEAQL